MNEIPVWNNINLGAPATSAHRVDLTAATHLQDVLKIFLEHLTNKQPELREIIESLKTEVLVLKRFLYKIAAIFIHDKTYQVLKQIYTAVNKLLKSSILSDIDCFKEQHNLTSTAGVMYVAPKPKYEYILVKLQGNVTLLARILCLCQHYGSILVQKFNLGHFINILIICMSSTSRIWALSLHLLNLQIELYESISKIYRTKGCIPSSAVSFINESGDYTLPLNLIDWLKSNQNLKEMHLLLRRQKRRQRDVIKPEIWQTIQVADEELENLRQLRDLVMNPDVEKTAITPPEAPIIEKKLLSVDIGELVPRGSNISKINKKKRKRAKKIKGHQLQT